MRIIGEVPREVTCDKCGVRFWCSRPMTGGTTCIPCQFDFNTELRSQIEEACWRWAFRRAFDE